MLLILSEKSDLTTDYLVLRLTERKIPFCRLNTEDFCNAYNISIDSRTSSFCLYKNASCFTPDMISAVYFRRPRLPALAGIVPKHEEKFITREIETLLSGYFSLLCENDHIRWLNKPKDILSANNKINQIFIAKQIGFLVPHTLISCSKNEIESFILDEVNVVAKAVTHGFYEYGDKTYIAFTQKVSKGLLESIDEYIGVPMILQREISKAYDIRVTVVGDQVFSTAIMSQEWEISKTDWRTWDVCDKFKMRHERICMPTEIEKRCLEINHHYNLKFSAIDMVLDTDGNYWFLEINPNGQWAWIENTVGYPIRDAIINYFEE